MTTLNSYAVQSISVPAGQEETINASGTFVSCLNCSAPSFLIGVDGASPQFMQPGLTFLTAAGERFTTLTVSNAPAESGILTVRLAVGDGDIRDSRLASQGLLQSRATSLSISDSAPIPLAAGAHRLIVASSDFDQRTFIKADPLNLQELRLDPSAIITTGYRLYPGEELIVRVRASAELYAFNPSAASANYVTMIEVIGTPDQGIPAS